MSNIISLEGHLQADQEFADHCATGYAILATQRGLSAEDPIDPELMQRAVRITSIIDQHWLVNPEPFDALATGLLRDDDCRNHAFAVAAKVSEVEGK